MVIENIQEYLVQEENYQDGRYNYETIATQDDLGKAIEEGKKFVFHKSSNRSLILSSLIFFLIGLIISLVVLFTVSIDMFIRIMVFFILIGIFSIISLIIMFITITSINRDPNFVIVGPEGIVYKFHKESPKGFNWEEISMEKHREIDSKSLLGMLKTELLIQKIIVSMPNGDLILPNNLSSREFRKHATRSVTMQFFKYFKEAIFFSYYELGKKERIDDLKMKIEQFRNTMGQLTLENWLSELKEVYKNYKEKKYQFRHYATSEQILTDILEGKKFVLKGGLRRVDWVFMIFLFGVGTLMWIIFSLTPYMQVLGLFWQIFFACVSLLYLVKLAYFIVISPSGVYYHKLLSKGSFQWNEVGHLEELSRNQNDIMGWWERTWLNVFFMNGRKIKFYMRFFKLKEFPRRIEKEMYYTLFQVFLNLNKH